MDIELALKIARSSSTEIINLIDGASPEDSIDVSDLAPKATELVDAFRAIDQWLSKGGFLPKAWERKPSTIPHPIDESCSDWNCNVCVKNNEFSYAPLTVDALRIAVDRVCELQQDEGRHNAGTLGRAYNEIIILASRRLESLKTELTTKLPPNSQGGVRPAVTEPALKFEPNFETVTALAFVANYIDQNRGDIFDSVVCHNEQNDEDNDWPEIKRWAIDAAIDLIVKNY